MNKSKYLIDNIFLFFLGNFGSKALTFILTPIYTLYLSTEQYGMVDLIQSTMNLLVPLLLLGSAEATMRFAMDKRMDNNEVLTFSIYILFGGTIILAISTPLLKNIEVFSNYAIYIPWIYFVTAGKGLLSQFCRGIEKIRLYVMDSLMTAAILLGLTIVFLAWLKWEAHGFLLAWIISNGVSCVFLVVSGKLYRYLTISSPISKEVFQKMLYYGLPLVPHSLSWSITSLLERYFVAIFCGLAINGLYSIAFRVPAIMAVFIEVFMQAWQLSAIKEYEVDRDNAFYCKVYKYYSTFIFLIGSGLILSSKLIALLLFKNEFYVAWKYVPLLMCAMTLANLQNYFGTLYTAFKKTNKLFITTISGALVSIALNLILIPWIEAYGAIIAIYISYIVVYIYRYTDTSKFIKININHKRIIATFLVMTAQAVLFTLDLKVSMLFNIAGFMVISIIHGNEIVGMLTTVCRYIKEFKNTVTTAFSDLD